MKTLLILRHGKSSRDDPGLPDHERPLAARGVRDAPRMGRLMAELGLAPDRIVSSTAIRAQTTARLAAAELGEADVVRLDPRLYFHGAAGYLEVLGELPGEVATALVVGHNPDVEDLVTHLTGASETLPTGALARVDLAIASWAEVGGDAAGTLAGVWRPREVSKRSR